MIAILIIGILLISTGASFVYVASRRRNRLHAMLATETLPVAQLEELRRISDELGQRGQFRKVCEVVGKAHPAPVGLLTSELAGVECVWHAHRVQRRYKHYDRDDDGTTVSTRTETVAEQVSPHGFALLQDDGLTIGVDHAGRHPDGALQVADRFEPVTAQAAAGGWAGTLGMLVTGGGDRDETLGYQYTEWVIRPGTPLYVLGEVHDSTGPLVIGPPLEGKAPFIMSTRSEAELTAAARRSQLLWARIGAAVAALGVLLAVLWLVL